jgi:hypothetical protein
MVKMLLLLLLGRGSGSIPYRYLIYKLMYSREKRGQQKEMENKKSLSQGTRSACRPSGGHF